MGVIQITKTRESTNSTHYQYRRHGNNEFWVVSLDTGFWVFIKPFYNIELRVVEQQEFLSFFYLLISIST